MCAERNPQEISRLVCHNKSIRSGCHNNDKIETGETLFFNRVTFRKYNRQSDTIIGYLIKFWSSQTNCNITVVSSAVLRIS